MSLEQTLKNAIHHLHSGQLDNEAQVKQAVILPILRALEWDDTDPEAFKPEYSVDSGFVDYALLDRGNPLIFVEAKRIGAADTRGEDQLFKYAAHRGVPFLVLTDGNRWDFYLSMASGYPDERRFYRLELTHEQNNREYVKFLDEHLRRDCVVSGQAKSRAEERHASNRERVRAHQAIPRAWQALLEGPDEMLRDLLAEAVESECGTKPDLDEVTKFLREHRMPRPEPDAGRPPPNANLQPKPPVPVRPLAPRAKIIGFSLEDERVETGTAIGALVEALKKFDRMDPEFMTCFASATVGRTRRLVARNRADLYNKARPDLANNASKDLENGWWLGSKISAVQVKKNFEIACRVAGVEFGSRLKLIYR